MKKVMLCGGLILLVMFVFSSDTFAQMLGPKVMFDPGHGGDVPGSLTPVTNNRVTPPRAYCEKDINLEVANKVQEWLDALGFVDSIDYVFTRIIDTTVANSFRARLACDLNVQRLVSIHHNSAATCPTTQRTEVLYSDLSTCDSTARYPGRTRNTDSTLATKIGYRIHDRAFFYQLKAPLEWRIARPGEGVATVLSDTYMESAITEGSFTCDAEEASKFYYNYDLHVDKEAVEIYNGWYSTHIGQGFGEVTFEYLNPGLSDPVDYNQHVQITIGFNGEPFEVPPPYEGCWAQEETISLYAFPFVKDGYLHTFHHWEWVDWETLEVYESVPYNPHQFMVFPDWNSVHWFRAVFTGGLYSGSFVTPQTPGANVQSGDTYLVQWSLNEGIQSTTTMYLDFSYNGGSTWTTILGPVPFDYGYERSSRRPASASPEDQAGKFAWSVPETVSDNCRLRIRAADYVDNEATILSNRFAIVECLPPYATFGRIALSPWTYRFVANIDVGVPVSSRLWDFGDGTSAYSDGSVVDHTYTRGGYFSPSLTVASNCGSYTALANFVLPISCPYATPDSDGDGMADDCDKCPGVPNPGQADADNDYFGDACDNCPANYNFVQTDRDLDGRGDVCDNCPDAANSSQTDTDNDLVGDACDNCPST